MSLTVAGQSRILTVFPSIALQFTEACDETPPPTKECFPDSLRSRNAQRWASGRSPDLRLSELSAFPGFPVAFCSALGDYSCGAVADSHRASQHQTGNIYR